MASLSNVSAQTADMKFLLASNGNVSNFVSVKLSSAIDYTIWKAQMLCLIKSQVLLHIIDAEYPFPQDKGAHIIAQYDQLVKGWIFGSMNRKGLKDFIGLNSAQEVWMELESRFNLPMHDRDAEGDSSNALDVFSRTEDFKYIQASNVNVFSFVTVKLFGRMNYRIWKAQMLCLIESQALLHIINAEDPFPVDKGVHMLSQYDKLVKGWIFGTMSNHVLNYFADFNSARVVWMELESRFGLSTRDAEGVPSNVLDISSRTEDLRFTMALQVNVFSFVSVKLSGDGDYDDWKTQMLWLIESHDLLHIIHAKPRFPWDNGDPMTKKFDKLV